MNTVIENIKNFLLGTVVDQYKSEVNERNYDYLKSLAIVGIITTCFTVIFGQIMRHVVTFNTEFLLLFAYFVVMFGRVIFFKNHIAHLAFSLYMWLTPLMAAGIMMGTFLDPLEPSITIMVFFCVLPLFILDKPWRILLFITISALAYGVCCYIAKPFDVFIADMIDLVLFYFLSLGINCLVLRDRLRNVEYAASMRRLSEVEELTDLYNRRAGERYVSELIEEGQSGMFCMLDVDDFKTINDQFGHVAGDLVLKAVANQLRACSGANDIVMRMGGDEFGVYAVDVADIVAGTEYVQRLFQAIDELVVEVTPNYKIHISLGGAFYPKDSKKESATLYHESDIALYKAKRNGKGRYCLNS